MTRHPDGYLKVARCKGLEEKGEIRWKGYRRLSENMTCRKASDEAQALQAGMAVLADDDVIMDRDAERLGGVYDHLRHVDIGA